MSKSPHAILIGLDKITAKSSKLIINLDEVKNIDALRCKKYVGCYINQHRAGDFTYFYNNAFASVEHLFNNH